MKSYIDEIDHYKNMRSSIVNRALTSDFVSIGQIRMGQRIFNIKSHIDVINKDNNLRSSVVKKALPSDFVSIGWIYK